MLLNDLYTKFINGKMSTTEWSKMKDEVNIASDKDLWNCMIENDTDTYYEERMPSKSKRQIKNSIIKKIWSYRIFLTTKYAAMICLLFMSTLGVLYLIGDKHNDQMITMAIETGNKAQMNLPDGTNVHLNGETTLSYNINNDKERLIELSGEAFFNVAKMPDCPFIVEVYDLKIEVTGTSFNVRSYGGNIIETSLISGQVVLSTSSLPEKCILKPGQKAIYNINDHTLQVVKADIHLETGWKDGYLIFQSENFMSVLDKIERWYGIKFIIETTSIEKDKLSGSFRHENINNVIDALSLQYNFRYRFEKDKIYIY